ncbi:hypothetical protein EYF80_044447 [Liparis tanakae]|uniref:Uncharacterized protein n=1 Tax=Liparis tanakae TaxID=230148 RepID=A0A4Z2FX74_9TELE|nr:hypothetical protein EYF80_044447 [Liparis tanakae]
MKEMMTGFTETRHGDKPRPSRSVSTLMARTRRTVDHYILDRPRPGWITPPNPLLVLEAASKAPRLGIVPCYYVPNGSAHCTLLKKEARNKESERKSETQRLPERSDVCCARSKRVERPADKGASFGFSSRSTAFIEES